MMPAPLSSTAAGNLGLDGHWLVPVQNWPSAAIRCLQTTGRVIRIVIASVRGSAPREVGVSMLVDGTGIFGTIGGGQLEWSAIATARRMLSESGTTAVQLHKLVLGPQLQQCCGGAVQVWFERYTSADMPMLSAAEEAAARGPAVLISKLAGTNIEHRIVRHSTFANHSTGSLRDATRASLTCDADSIALVERLDRDEPRVWLYGAGHVGQALARLLATLPVQLTWIDSRSELLPLELSPAVRVQVANDPVATVHEAPDRTHFLVMTHSHLLDYELCNAILRRDGASWLGLIGSRSKGVRFRTRLLNDGVPRQRVDCLVCPIGIGGIASKEPSVIAVSVAAQLLQRFGATQSSDYSEAQPCTSHGCHICQLDAEGKQ